MAGLTSVARDGEVGQRWNLAAGQRPLAAAIGAAINWQRPLALANGDRFREPRKA